MDRSTRVITAAVVLGAGCATTQAGTHAGSGAGQAQRVASAQGEARGLKAASVVRVMRAGERVNPPQVRLGTSAAPASSAGAAPRSSLAMARQRQVVQRETRAQLNPVASPQERKMTRVVARSSATIREGQRITRTSETIREGREIGRTSTSIREGRTITRSSRTLRAADAGVKLEGVSRPARATRSAT